MNLDEERKAFEEWFRESGKHSLYIEHMKGNNPSLKNAFTIFDTAWQSWQAAKAHEAEKLKGCVVVTVTPDEDLCEKLEDMASVTPAYAGRYIYKVAIGELDYHWECGLIGIEEAARGGNE